jgi:hypothetical protein
MRTFLKLETIRGNAALPVDFNVAAHKDTLTDEQGQKRHLAVVLCLKRATKT